MALPVLDGNQSATTLSSVVTGGEHIVAHSVVSLGANAISDITSAVSGSVVSISNFPSTQTVAGTVTANVALLNDNGAGSAAYFVTGQDVNAIRTVIYSGGDFSGDQGAPVDGMNPLPVSLNSAGIPAISGTVTVGNTVTIAGTVTANVGNLPLATSPNDWETIGDQIGTGLNAAGLNVDVASLPAISGTVTVGNSVTIAGTVTANPTGTQTVAGTVTANLNIGSDISPAFVTPINNWIPYESGDDSLNINIKNIGTGANAVGSSLPISGTVTANVNFASVNDSEPAAGVKIGYQNTGGDYVPVREDGNGFPVNVINVVNSLPISGTVTANPTGTQTIAGTVTATLSVTFDQAISKLDQSIEVDGNSQTGQAIAIGWNNPDYGDFKKVSELNPLPVQLRLGEYSDTQPISGTVTANAEFQLGGPSFVVEDGGTAGERGVQIAFLGTNNSEPFLVGDARPLPVYGTVTVGAPLNGDLNAVAVALHPSAYDGNTIFGEAGAVNPILGVKPIYHADVTDSGVSAEVKETAGLPIRGSIGELTTRFGSVTTASVAELTSAVTNTSRKYLLVQNIASSTVTIGIGFAPTTTRGIQLTAGAGITFESSYIPTGAVYVLSSVTASNFTILEG